VTEDDIKYDHLVGRPFTGVGRDDCFALAREFYEDNFNISVLDVARPHDWSSDELDLLRLFHEKLGFQMITDWKPKDLRPGDIMAMAIGERNANHLAVYAGNSKIVHHLYGKMSRAEDLRDFWFNHTCYILRHPDVPDLRPVYPDVDLLSLIHARNATPKRR